MRLVLVLFILTSPFLFAQKPEMKQLIVDALVFDHTPWTFSQVNRLMNQAIKQLKQRCQIDVIESKTLKASLSDYEAEIDFERELGMITEETLEIIGEKTQIDYEKRGIVVLFLDTNGSVDGTLGEANTGERQVSIFYHDFSPMITGRDEIAFAHSEDSPYNVVLHELVHLFSGDSGHPQTQKPHVLHGSRDLKMKSNYILDEHCEMMRASQLLKVSNK